MMALDKQQILRQFDKSAQGYDAVAGMQRDIADRLIQSMPAEIQQTAKLLDMGCGTGNALQKIAQRYPDLSLSGVDIAPAMLQQAKAVNSQVVFKQVDMEWMPFADASFDYVFSSSSIQWCDLTTVCSEIGRVIKANGNIYVSTFTLGTLAGWRELWIDQPTQTQHQFVTTKQIYHVLSTLGFKHVSLEQQLIKQTFTSFSEAVESIRQLGAGNATMNRRTGLMGKQKFARIKQQIEQRLSDFGVIELPYHVAYITARATQNTNEY